MSVIRLKTCTISCCTNQFPEHYIADECSDFHLQGSYPHLRHLLWKLPATQRERIRTSLDTLWSSKVLPEAVPQASKSLDAVCLELEGRLDFNPTPALIQEVGVTIEVAVTTALREAINLIDKTNSQRAFAQTGQTA